MLLVFFLIYYFILLTRDIYLMLVKNVNNHLDPSFNSYQFIPHMNMHLNTIDFLFLLNLSTIIDTIHIILLLIHCISKNYHRYLYFLKIPKLYPMNLDHINLNLKNNQHLSKHKSIVNKICP